MRVLFTTSPLHGHFYPLVPLAWACRSRGHEVLVAAADSFLPTVLNAGLPAVSNGPGADVRGLSDSSAAHGIGDARYAHGEVFAQMAAHNLAGTLDIVDAWQPDVLVSERAEFAGPIAAGARRLPHVELRWGVAELDEYRSAAEAVMRTELKTLGLDGLPVPNVLLNPWPPSLRLPHAVDHLSVRHMPYDGTARVPTWLLSPPARRRVCLTMGTLIPSLANGDLSTLVRDTLRSLVELDCELVIAMDDQFAERLKPLPAAVIHAGRVPLSVLLRTCELFINHGGQGSALTALATGCPQVVLPKFDDMFENADAVIGSGAGVALPLGQATPARIAEEAGRILDGPQFRAAALDIAREISSQPTPFELVEVLEQLARRPGEVDLATVSDGAVASLRQK